MAIAASPAASGGANPSLWLIATAAPISTAPPTMPQKMIVVRRSALNRLPQ